MSGVAEEFICCSQLIFTRARKGEWELENFLAPASKCSDPSSPATQRWTA